MAIARWEGGPAPGPVRASGTSPRRRGCSWRSLGGRVGRHPVPGEQVARVRQGGGVRGDRSVAGGPGTRSPPSKWHESATQGVFVVCSPGVAATRLNGPHGRLGTGRPRRIPRGTRHARPNTRPSHPGADRGSASGRTPRRRTSRCLSTRGRAGHPVAAAPSRASGRGSERRRLVLLGGRALEAAGDRCRGPGADRAVASAGTTTGGAVPSESGHSAVPRHRPPGSPGDDARPDPCRVVRPCRTEAARTDGRRRPAPAPARP